jgi:uncharacterized protein YecE (DUF72 family)
MHWYVGTSGWSYESWTGGFYPPRIRPAELLAFYARHFNAIEINNTFYHLPSARQIKAWERAVPSNFTFAIKASRYITHQMRLKDPGPHIARLMEPLSARTRPGPIIFQLPPRFPKDPERLEQFLKALPEGQRCAFEFRDPSWHAEDIYELLRNYNAAFCMFEKGSCFSPRIATADFLYVRLHGREEGYRGNYSDEALKDWCNWLSRHRKDVYIFFDNTAEECSAVENAATFRKLASDQNL